MIDKLKLQDGGGSEYQYLDEDGVSWRNKSEYLQMEILGFCGCGNPDEVMIYVKNYLQDCNDSKFGSYEDIPYMFLAYWADHNGYTEHGTTVRCSWLTDKGKELLSDINWCLENEPNS
jgi:hypothetical protein